MATVDQRPTIRTTIGGLSIPELAAEFGTPSYLYDAQVIKDRIDELHQFDVIRYAQKACSNLAVVDFVRKNGVCVDAVSAGEIRRAFAAGYQATGEPHPIVYTADIFDREALELCVEHNIHVNVGSPDMIDQLGKVAPGRDITLRINPGFGHGHSQKTNTGGAQSKHGIWHEDVADCLIRADRNNLVVTGVHMHIGSGTDFEHLAQVCGAMEKTVAEVGRTINTISAGGGLPTPYRSGDERVDIGKYFQLWDATRNRMADEFGHAIRLEIEPGRYLSAESGYLLTEVRALKKMGDNQFYLVDAGFNNLARPILYGAYHPMSVCPASGVDDGRSSNDVIVGGPLCESGDIFTQEEGGFVAKRTLPAAEVGDYLIIECAGAYGFVMSSNYNSKPMAAELFLNNGKAFVARKRQTFEDIVRGESIPQ